MDHHLLKPVITWQWLHALGWNLALTFCKLYKCEFFFVANEQKKLSLIIILGEELKATEEVILITRLFQMIKVWMPNCISHLHHHIYDHIFACLQWRKLQVVEKIPCERLKLFLNGLLGLQLFFIETCCWLRNYCHFSVIEHAKAWSYYRYYITHRKAQDWCEQETP